MTPSEKEEFANVLREGITFIPQVGDYLINQSVFDYLEHKINTAVTNFALVEGAYIKFMERFKVKQTPCTSCGVTELITKGFCNCCGAKQ